ncbi:hypothetical protein PAXRUDRAFT_778900 [Paxillus rubicundulus Ve08.2h10]|uniref:Uncharacterized protein n=1 Tax=Paxillus rubicundulus Ve08.2h10 TaxID=930991 RepID=A0A0D0DX01_9AGAM|nr:hypothetical protein PAXRUDRAFT_778900 [Paxillus rubicundulus Ve08.2h10]
MDYSTTVDCVPVSVAFARSLCALVCTTTYYCTSPFRYIFNGLDGDMTTKALSTCMTHLASRFQPWQHAWRLPTLCVEASRVHTNISIS